MVLFDVSVVDTGFKIAIYKVTCSNLLAVFKNQDIYWLFLLKTPNCATIIVCIKLSQNFIHVNSQLHVLL